MSCETKLNHNDCSRRLPCAKSVPHSPPHILYRNRAYIHILYHIYIYTYIHKCVCVYVEREQER